MGEAHNPGPQHFYIGPAAIDDPEGETIWQTQTQEQSYDTHIYDIGGEPPTGCDTQQCEYRHGVPDAGQWTDQFKASASFMGAMPGWFYTMGNKGLG